MTHEKHISCARYMEIHHDLADTSICIRSEANSAYSVGDILRLREWVSHEGHPWNVGNYTGRELMRVVVAVKRGAYGLHKGAAAIAHRRIEV